MSGRGGRFARIEADRGADRYRPGPGDARDRVGKMFTGVGVLEARIERRQVRDQGMAADAALIDTSDLSRRTGRKVAVDAEQRRHADQKRLRGPQVADRDMSRLLTLDNPLDDLAVHRLYLIVDENRHPVRQVLEERVDLRLLPHRLDRMR